MALPIIVVDSATGSDSAASGAGPGDGITSGSALTGTAASTDGTGLVVTLDGSPDLTNVATDGSHVIYLVDATAGKRNFGKITAKDNTAKTVTVSDAFGLSISGKSWAIGGKRASIGSTSSRLLGENNAAAGDAMPGWTIRMLSGHTETMSAAYVQRRSGDNASGPITIEGASGAATLPIVTFSNNGVGFQQRATGLLYRDFEVRNTNATKTASYAFQNATSGGFALSRMRCTHATDKFYIFADATANGVCGLIESCDVRNCANIGIRTYTAGLVNCLVASCGSDGIVLGVAGTRSPLTCICNVSVYNSGNGINWSSSGAAAGCWIVYGNVYHGNSSAGLNISSDITSTMFTGSVIANNQFTYNGTYGIAFQANWDDEFIRYSSILLAGNNLYQNTSGKWAPTLTSDQNTTEVTPTSASLGATKDYAGTVGGFNFAGGTNAQSEGWPQINVGNSSGAARNYQDQGLGQVNSGGGGSTVIVVEDE